jgi:cell division protein YceG involved in septum cleavage
VNRKIISYIMFLVTCMFFFQPMIVKAETEKNLTAQIQLTQYLMLEIPSGEERQELIEMYQDGGWVANGEFFVKEVNHSEVPVLYKLN